MGLTIRCSDHPTYRGIRKPRVDCLACWKIYRGDVLNDMESRLRLQFLTDQFRCDPKMNGQHLYSLRWHGVGVSIDAAFENDPDYQRYKELMEATHAEN